MKGKLDIRFDMPNLGRVRSRIENPSKELTSQLRQKLGEIVVKQLNASTLAIRAEFINYLNSLNLTFKSEAHKLQVLNVTNSLFDALFATTQAELDALVGSSEAPAVEPDASDEEIDSEAPAEIPQADPDDFE